MNHSRVRFDVYMGPGVFIKFYLFRRQPDWTLKQVTAEDEIDGTFRFFSWDDVQLEGNGVLSKDRYVTPGESFKHLFHGTQRIMQDQAPKGMPSWMS